MKLISKHENLITFVQNSDPINILQQSPYYGMKFDELWGCGIARL